MTGLCTRERRSSFAVRLQGDCHVVLTFATGFAYSADVTFTMQADQVPPRLWLVLAYRPKQRHVHGQEPSRNLRGRRARCRSGRLPGCSERDCRGCQWRCRCRRLLRRGLGRGDPGAACGNRLAQRRHLGPRSPSASSRAARSSAFSHSSQSSAPCTRRPPGAAALRRAPGARSVADRGATWGSAPTYTTIAPASSAAKPPATQ